MEINVSAGQLPQISDADVAIVGRSSDGRYGKSVMSSIAAGSTLLWGDTGFEQGPTANEIANAQTYAEQAEAAAAILGSVTEPVIQTLTIDSTGAGPYALDYDPGTATALSVYLNGLYQQPDRDYTVAAMPSATSGMGITFTEAPLTGYVVDMSYRVSLGYDPAVNTAQDYASWTAFSAAVAGGFTAANGHVVRAGGAEFKALSGSTKIAGLTGWVANGAWTPQHFADIDLTGATDCTAAFSSAFDVARDAVVSGGIYSVPHVDVDIRIPPGTYLCTGSIDATGIVGVKTSVSAYGSTIISRATGKTAFDMLGSRWFSIRGMKITGDQSYAPAIGRQIGRDISQDPAGGHTFIDCVFDGYFTRACQYNLASEVNIDIGGTSINKDTSSSSYVSIVDGTNHWAAITDFATPIVGITYMSCLQNKFEKADHRKSAGGPTVWLSAVKQFYYTASYLVNYDNAAVVLADDGNGFENLYFDLHTETTGMKTMFDCQRLPSASHTTAVVNGIYFRDHNSHAGDQFIKVDAAYTFLRFTDADMAIDCDAVPTNRMTNSPTKLSITGRLAATDDVMTNFTFTGALIVPTMASITTFPSGVYTAIDRNGLAYNVGGIAPRVTNTDALGTANLNFSEAWVGRYRGSQQSIANDVAISITPPATSGELIIHGPGSTSSGVISFTNTTCSLVAGLANIAVTTGVLTGTTGAVNKLTVSMSSGTIYIENRTGTTATVRWTFIN